MNATKEKTAVTMDLVPRLATPPPGLGRTIYVERSLAEHRIGLPALVACLGQAHPAFRRRRHSLPRRGLRRELCTERFDAADAACRRSCRCQPARLWSARAVHPLLAGALADAALRRGHRILCQGI